MIYDTKPKMSVQTAQGELHSQQQSDVQANVTFAVMVIAENSFSYSTKDT